MIYQSKEEKKKKKDTDHFGGLIKRERERIGKKEKKNKKAH